MHRKVACYHRLSQQYELNFEIENIIKFAML